MGRMHERWRDSFLGWWGRAVVSHRWFVLAIALLLSAGSVWVSVRGLEMQTDRSLLVDPDLDWNAAYLRYKTSFDRWGDVLVVIDQGGPGVSSDRRTQAQALAHELTDRLESEPTMDDVAGVYDRDARHVRLVLSLPEAEFQQRWNDIRQSTSVLESASLTDYLRATVGRLSSTSDANDVGQVDTSGVDRLAEMLERMALVGQGEADSILEETQDAHSYLTTRSQRYIILSVSVNRAADESVSGIGRSVSLIREHLGTLLAKPEYSEIEAGVTGIGAIEHDETEQSIQDSTWTSILAFSLIALLMFIVFRGWYVPAAIGCCLIVGIVWSFGFATLAVGHLQVLSVVFTAILLGLGVDFGLHIIARLELARESHAKLREVYPRVLRAIGPGMITGAITTSAAFGVMLLTEFRGVAEMGLIAGGGILLCMISMLALLPVLLTLRGDWRKAVRHRHGGENAHFAHGRLDVIDRRPRLVLATALVLVIVGGWQALSTKYDPNLLHLHPPGVESVEWERRLVADSGQSSWIGMSVADSLEDAREKTLAFYDQSELVGSVGGIGALFHPQRTARQEMAVQSMPADIPQTQPGPRNHAIALLSQVQGGIDLLGESTPSEVRQSVSRLRDTVVELLELLESDRGATAWQHLTQAWMRDRASVISTWQALISDEEPSLDDLPEPVRLLNTGDDGQLLLRIYPSGANDESVLSPERLGPFVAALRDVDPHVLGPAVQVYESTHLIARAYSKATVLALCVIFVLLWIDFRSVADAVCALLPVLVGFVMMFAIMGMTGLALNFANIIVMPVIFGIGVDAGVHIVHRWREDPSGIPRGLSGGTGRSIGLTLLTTMIGFGCLSFAEHRGIRGLGLTMLIGLSMTLLACYSVAPAVLRCRMNSPTSLGDDEARA